MSKNTQKIFLWLIIAIITAIGYIAAAAILSIAVSTMLLWTAVAIVVMFILSIVGSIF